MDLGTLLGTLMGFAFVAAAILIHGQLSDFVDIPGALVAFGGSFSALFVYFPARRVFGLFSLLGKCLFNQLPDPRAEILRFTQFSAISRRNGLLALDKETAGITDPFLRRGMEMVIDGTPREKIEEMLQLELACIQERHSVGKKMFEQLGASLPAFGMVGTLIGLIQMLNKLDEPSQIGAGMAVAMVTTFYGAFAANMVCLPLAGKLDNRSKEETLLRELMIQGLIALTQGEGPRAIESRLKSFLAPGSRQLEDTQIAA
jgi:chemotaxis protein MotA